MTMWKESYRLGVENIDNQHKKLFEMAGKLVEEIKGAQRTEVFKDTIVFLKNYVVTHFRDEEIYFESIGYAEEKEHKKQHRELTHQVEKYAVQLEQTDYDLHMVKKLAGMLSAWLVYHVVKEDMKYTGKGKQDIKHVESSYSEYFASSTIQVLEAMVGIDPEDVEQAMIYDVNNLDDVYIEIGLTGDLKGKVVFGFTKEFAKQLVEAMVSFAPEEIDELVCSALAEVSNIATGNGTIAIAEGGTACDICPPKVLENGLSGIAPYEKVQIDTKIGKMTISVYLD